jgi:mannose-6-phosphate isomerase-like protein (cupin superfamily)
MLNIKNISDCLQNQAAQDALAGIAIAPLLESYGLSFFVTELAPGKAVTAHYHERGQEIYFIVSGTGTIHTAPADGTLKQTQIVCAGDIFHIEPKIVHSLENTGSTALTLLFACHPDHLGSDRVIGSI